LEEGYVPEHGDMNSVLSPSEWVEGRPQTSFWSGFTSDGKARYKINALRCVNCGHLELYAREPADG
jgi:hypothetical protein